MKIVVIDGQEVVWEVPLLTAGLRLAVMQGSNCSWHKCDGNGSDDEGWSSEGSDRRESGRSKYQKCGFRGRTDWNYSGGCTAWRDYAANGTGSSVLRSTEGAFSG